MEISSFMSDIVNEYYKNNARKIKNIVNKVISHKFGGIADKDISEYYLIADDVMVEIIQTNKFDKRKGDFDGYFYNTLIYAFIDFEKHGNRQKRRNTKFVLDSKGNKVLDENGKPQKVIIPDVSFDEPIKNGEESCSYGDIIADQCNVEDDVLDSFQPDEKYSEKMCRYLDKLSKLQKAVLSCIAEGYRKKEILEELHISEQVYIDCCEAIHSYKNISVLLNNEKIIEKSSDKHSEKK